MQMSSMTPDTNDRIVHDTVPVDDRFITEVPFNHYDLMFGINVTTLVNIPSLIVIESYG